LVQAAKKARANKVAQMRAGVLQKLQAQMYSFMQENADEMALVGKIIINWSISQL